MVSGATILIDIASASQQVINASVAYEHSRSDRNVNLSRIRLGGQLHRIVAASQTLLNETLQIEDSASHSVVHSRLTAWLSSNEPQECLDSLHTMETLIRSSSRSMVSTFRKPFRVNSPEDKIKDAIQILEKRKDCFYFLLTTDVWNQTIDKDFSRLAVVKQPESMVGIASAKGTDITEQDSVNHRRAQDAAPIKLNQTRFTIDQAQLDELLKWLDAWNCTPKHEDTLELRQPNTCTWLTNTIEYATWRNIDNSFLWLNGKPGSGKSVLAASVIDGVEKTLGEGEFLVFFYCDFRSERSTASAEVIRSLLSQLLRGLCDFGVDPGDILSDLFKEKRRKGSILANAKRLVAFVSRAAKRFSRQPLMVIDALDECSDVENLLDALVSMTKGGIKLFVVSRPLQMIKDGFSGLKKISLEKMSKDVSADINLHVAKEVESHRRLRIVDPMLKEEISQALCEKADGMFRWVECQLVTLKRCLTVVAIREALESLPIGLEATYERIFFSMKNEDKEAVLSRRALMWLVAALKPLTLREIVEALSIDVGGRALNRDVGPVHGPALLDTLGSLVTHNEETDIVILSHFSVKEYLVTEHHDPYHINPLDAHAQLARQCMSYIAACLKIEHGTSEDLHPLLEYVLSCGFDHLDHVCSHQTILSAIMMLDLDIQQYPSTWKLMLASHYRHVRLPSIEHDFVLYILIRYARESLLRFFLSRFPLQPKDGTNPLIYVTWQQPDYARILLSYGAKLNHPGRFVRDYGFGPTTGLPIEAAVRDGNRELLDLLIEEDSPVPCRLFLVAILDDISITAHTVARLMQTDQFVEWATEIGDEVVLLRALDYQWYDDNHIPRGDDMLVMTRRLKQIGCDLTPHDFFRQAVRTGHVSTIEYFLTEFQISLPSDILFYLPPRDGPGAPAIRCLLRHGADVHCLLHDDSTVLHHFIEQCRKEDDCLEVTKILCKAGCDPSARNLHGKTPIHIAAHHGFISVVKHLLSIDAPLPSDILLHLYGCQSRKLSPKTICFLLGKGASVDAVAPNGDTLLHLALHPSLFDDDYPLDRVKTLVLAGCNTRVPNSLGQTPLELAVANGQLPIVKYLLSTLDTPLPHNLLQFATSSCGDNFPMVHFLLAKGADAHMTSSDKHKALHRAMMAGSHWDDSCYLQVAQILAEAGCAQPYTCDCTGETLLHAIVHHRCIKVLKSLLSRGVPLPSDILLAPRYENEDLGMIQLLLENGADARAVGTNGDTPLHHACRFSDPERLGFQLQYAEILIRAGSDPCAVNSSNRTPVHEAVDGGHLTVVKYLLSLHVPLPPDILLTAAKSCSSISSTIRFLIDNGAAACSMAVNGDNALHLALAHGDDADRLEVAKILIGAGCDIHAKNSTGETPLFVAAKAGHIAIVKYFLSQGEPLPHVILLAAASRCFEAMSTIRSLVDMGVDVTRVRAVASNGDTALHHAAKTNFPKILQFFIDNGCDPLVRNLAGETPLHVAARSCHISVVRYLLSIGVPLPSNVLLSVASGDSWGMSPMIRLLVREGADLHAVNDNGDAPLHVLLNNDFSHHSDKWDAIQTLLDSGCNPCTRNRDGQTPADLAEAKGPFFLRNVLRLVKNAQNVPKPR